MRSFQCDHCGHLVFFDSTTCVQCGSLLSFVPEQMRVVAMRPEESRLHQQALTDISYDTYVSASTRGLEIEGARWHLCANRVQYQACNFAIPDSDPNHLCVSCRQTRWVPDLSIPANLRRWQLIENAKRRLFYTLAKLHLTALHGIAAPNFEFLADIPGSPPVMTGHLSGTIVLNVAEADDDERARRRMELHEPYRTLLGHLRHESGHFYWDILIRDYPEKLDAFRQIFGDERKDYAQSLQAHYAIGPAGPLGWQDNYISAYATSHPWEDWAETWAHYLHLVDLMETASDYQTQITTPGSGRTHCIHDPFAILAPPFHEMLSSWIPLTLLLNSLNRSLGQQDAYPFAISMNAVAKLEFIHNLLLPLRHRPLQS